MVNDRCIEADEKTVLLEAAKTQYDSFASWNDLNPHFGPLLASTFIALIAGLNDGNLGIIIPRLKDYYHITDTSVSALFLCNGIGFFLAAACNGYLLHKLGQRWIILVGAIAIIIAYLILAQGLAFPIMCLSLVIQGGGVGLMDSAINVYAANIPMATFILGILHGVYSVGTMISPVVTTHLLAHSVSWKETYVFLLVVAMINLVLVLVGYRNVDLDGKVVSCIDQPDFIDECDQQSEILNRMTLLGGFYILMCAGIEVCIGSWGYLYLTENMHADEIQMGYVISGYWGSLVVGRIVLGWIANKYNEKKMVSLFTIALAVLLFLVYIIPNIWLDSIFIILVGLFIGPLYPTCISLASKFFPRSMYPMAIGFMSAFGAGGAAFFPYFAGQMSGLIGLKYLPLSWFACAIVMQVLWILTPNGSKK